MSSHTITYGPRPQELIKSTTRLETKDSEKDSQNLKKIPFCLLENKNITINCSKPVRLGGTPKTRSCPVFSHRISPTVPTTCYDKAFNLECDIENRNSRINCVPCVRLNLSVRKVCKYTSKLREHKIPFSDEEVQQLYKLIVENRVALFHHKFPFPVCFNVTIGIQRVWIEVHQNSELFLILRNQVMLGTYKSVFKAYRLNRVVSPVAYLVSEFRMPPINKNFAVNLKLLRKKVAISRNEVKYFSKLQKPWTNYTPELHKEFVSTSKHGVVHCMIMEWFESDLQCEMARTFRSPVTNSDLVKLNKAITILKILTDLHSKNIVHRDIKLENFLLNPGIIVITDFGCTCPADDLSSFADTGGSIKYASPELLKNPKGPFGPWVDVWAAGCLLWLLFADDFYPWMQDLEVREDEKVDWVKRIVGVIAKMDRLDKMNIDGLHPIVRVVKNMLLVDSSRRITAEKALEDLCELESITRNDECEFFKSFYELTQRMHFV